MAKKLQVKSVVTANGKTPVYDENRQPVFRTSIVELAAERELRRLSARMPAHFRMEFEIIDAPDEELGISNAELKDRLKQLEKQDEKNTLEDRIKELEAKLAQKDSQKLNGLSADNTLKPAAAPVEELKAAEKIAKIKEATTAEEVDAIVGTDDRKSVVDAAEKRKAQF